MSIIAAGTTSNTALVNTGNTDGTLQLQVNGTTPSVTLATTGAVGVGSTPGYGTNGQVLTSSGSSAAPTWTTAGASLTTPSFTTTIGVGAATASASGAGITFPATQSASSDANTLDDYEEGTWTPAVTGGTLTVNTATYTKIGNRLLLYFDVKFTSVPAASNITITGLPFSVTTGGSEASIGPLGGDKYSFASALTLTSAFFQGTNVFFFFQTSGNNASRMTDSNITSDTTLRCSTQYKV